MDQKQNPTAVVDALKFLARLMKQNDKFMITQKSVYPSDEEADLIDFGQTGQIGHPFMNRGQQLISSSQNKSNTISKHSMRYIFF
jgi:hypothetical protein